MFNFSNWSLRKKINAVVFLAAAVMLSILIQVNYLFNKLEGNGDFLRLATDLQVNMSQLDTAIEAVGNRVGMHGMNLQNKVNKPELILEVKDWISKINDEHKVILEAESLKILTAKENEALNNAYKNYTETVVKLIASTTYDQFIIEYQNFEKAAAEYAKVVMPLNQKLEEFTNTNEEAFHQEIRNDELIIVTIGLIGMLIISLVLSYFAKSISKSVNTVVANINELANGNYGLDIKRAETTEEIGSLVNASYHLRESVERSITLQSVIDRLAMAVMMCDKDYKIVYANKKAVDTLRKIENLIPIKVDNLIGTNIDIFHKNPSHQRGLLADHSRLPHNTHFNIGPETMRLSANIIQDYSGKFNGAFIDWDIITAQVKAEEAVKQAQAQIKNVIQAVREGDLNARVNVEQFEGYYRELAQGMNELVDTVKEPIDRSIESLTKLSQGDLMARMEGEYNGDFKAIQTSLNATIDKLKNVVFEIRQSSESVTSASTEISSGSTDLSMRTEQQASSLEETAASMEELTKAVRNNTETSSKASSLAQEAERNAEEGGQVANNAVNAMNEIEASSSKMADIIGVIDEIAFQINLLALNAAVEAARAGDAGKGFAVVASEVRALAGRSAAASKEIRELISTSTEQVASGAGLVKSAGDALNKILGSIKEVSKLMSEIAGASKEQAQGIEEVNAAVAQMDEMTQQNAALVEENTAAAQSLVDLAGGLTKLINFFSVNDNESGEASAHHLLNSERKATSHNQKPLPPKPNNSNASKSFERPANKNPRPAEPKKAAASNGGSTKGGGYNEGWEEF